MTAASTFRKVSPRTARLINAVWMSLCVFAALLFTCSLFDPLLQAQSVFKSKTAMGLLALAIGCGAIRFLAPIRMRAKLLLLVFGFFAAETMLQLVAWLGLLPAVNTKEHLPWGRVYWTAEGRGNSIRNRYAWHCPEFRLGNSNRVAVIGDSFVEAVEVKRPRNLGALLDRRAFDGGSDLAFLTLGEHGTSPAQYLELLRYGHHYFGLKEAIYVVYLGNDISDCSRGLKLHNPAEYIVYERGSKGQLVLDEQGQRTRVAYQQRLETMHRSPIVFLPRLLVSHSMLVQVPLSIRNGILLRRSVQRDPARAPGAEAELAQLGLKAEAFAVEPSPVIREGMTILQLLVSRAAEYAASNQIKLRLVTVPFFPPDFYQQHGTNWTARLGAYDFLKPEQELVAWAREKGLPILPLGQQMQRLTPAEIRRLYFSNGSGHFSEAGHRFASEAIWRAYFTQH